ARPRVRRGSGRGRTRHRTAASAAPAGPARSPATAATTAAHPPSPCARTAPAPCASNPGSAKPCAMFPYSGAAKKAAARGRPPILRVAWILEVVLDHEADRARSRVAGRTLVGALGFARATAVRAEGRAAHHVFAEFVDGGDHLLVEHVEHVDLEHQVAVGEGRTVSDVQVQGALPRGRAGRATRDDRRTVVREVVDRARVAREVRVAVARGEVVTQVA